MLRNYFKIAYRNLKKQKVFTVINVVGLAIGMSIALLSIAMYLELSQFDEFHPDASNSYRMTTKVIESGDVVHYASAPPALMYKIDEQVEGITSVHISDSFFPTLLHNENEIETWGYYTERDFFKVFDFPMAAGSPEALDQPNQIIVTQELARKLFKDESAIGKVIETKKDGPLVVAGVLKAFPKRTHLQFDFLIGLSSAPQFSAGSAVTNWTQFKGHYYYFNIQPDRKEEIVSLVSKLGETGDSHFQEDGKEVTYQLQPLSNITPGEMLSDTIGLEFDRATMIFFFGLGLLILIPACFNYTNMSIAVALKRSKEVGIRKVMGSHHKQIMGQFLVETVIICLLAVSLSAIIFHFVKLEFISMLTGASAIDLSLSIWLILAFVLFAVITGLITGIGPASYFSKISPIQALRSDSTNQKISLSGVRKGLLVVQFTLTLSFMIGIGVLVKEYYDVRGHKLPIEANRTFLVHTQNQDVQLIKNSYSKMAEVKNLSFSSSIPGTPLGNTLFLHFEDQQDSLRSRQIFVDPAFSQHMDWNYLWGQEIGTEAHQIEHVLANQSLMRKLRQFTSGSDTTLITLSDGTRAQIVGMIQDYNHEPLNHRIEPMLVRSGASEFNFAILSLTSPADETAYANLENVWEGLFPDIPFQASLLSNEIDEAYSFFKVGLQIFGFLAALAISISILGLLGMVIFTTESRTKEVAIRKILGANYLSLVGTLAQLFIRLWVIALIIAIPLSYFFYDNVLIQLYNKFSHGVGLFEIGLSVFVASALCVVAVLGQVSKIARINPATNLRNE